MQYHSDNSNPVRQNLRPGPQTRSGEVTTSLLIRHCHCQADRQELDEQATLVAAEARAIEELVVPEPAPTGTLSFPTAEPQPSADGVTL